jgi:hypothetical protein
MRNYIEPVGIYPEFERFGDYLIFSEVSEEIIDDDIMEYYGIRNDFERRTIYRFIKLGSKSVGNRIVLDDPRAYCIMDTGIFERATNQRFVNEAFGDVLIFGLGLGFVLLPLISDPSVNTITVVENNPIITEKISAYLSVLEGYKKIKIVEGDANTYYTEVGSKKFDYIYFDHFFNFNKTIVNNMSRLKPKYESIVRGRTMEVSDDIKSKYSRILKNSEGKIAYWGEDFLNNL